MFHDGNEKDVCFHPLCMLQLPPAVIMEESQPRSAFRNGDEAPFAEMTVDGESEVSLICAGEEAPASSPLFIMNQIHSTTGKYFSRYSRSSSP